MSKERKESKKPICTVVIQLHDLESSYVECDLSASKPEIVDELVNLIEREDARIRNLKAELNRALEFPWEHRQVRVDDIRREMRISQVAKRKLESKDPRNIEVTG